MNKFHDDESLICKTCVKYTFYTAYVLILPFVYHYTRKSVLLVLNYSILLTLTQIFVFVFLFILLLLADMLSWSCNVCLHVDIV